MFVDFFAEWCGPCKQVAPKLEAYAEQYPDVTFLKVDVDNDATQELSSKNGISAMPTFIAFLGGEEVGKVVGANLAKMEDLIKKCAPRYSNPAAHWPAAGCGPARHTQRPHDCRVWACDRCGGAWTRCDMMCTMRCRPLGPFVVSGPMARLRPSDIAPPLQDQSAGGRCGVACSRRDSLTQRRSERVMAGSSTACVTHAPVQGQSAEGEVCWRRQGARRRSSRRRRPRCGSRGARQGGRGTHGWRGRHLIASDARVGFGVCPLSRCRGQW